MKRVMVLGGPGAGKADFARRLGEITGLPVFHLGREALAAEERQRQFADILEREEWILEGRVSGACRESAARADTAIWLDLPLGLRLRRIVKRSRQDRGQTRPQQSDPTLLRHLWRTRHSTREKIAAALAGAPHLTVHHIRTRKGAETLLQWIADDHG